MGSLTRKSITKGCLKTVRFYGRDAQDLVFKKIVFEFYLFLKEREREREQEGEGQRVGDTESQADSVPSAPSPTWGSNSR